MPSRFLATALAAGLTFAGIAADDEDAAFVTVEDVEVKAGKGEVTVSGTVDFGGEVAFAAFEDDGGDSLAPGQGFDITGGTISQEGSEITFRMDLGDVALGDVQPGALFNWNIGVSGADEQRLFAWRNEALNGAPGEWYFSVVTFGDQGFLSSGVTGAFTGDAIEWYVQDAQIAASGGARIGMGDGPITASQGLFGAIQLTEFVDYDEAMWTADGAFSVGGGVDLVLANDAEEFDLQPRTRRNAFSGTFSDVPAGTYTLTITSRFADIEFVQERKVKVS